MTKVVWKYTLAETAECTIDIPLNAEILTVKRQDTNICLWALVDSDTQKIKRHFRVYGTGEPIRDSNIRYVGTATFFQNNDLVLHVFEILK